MAKKAATNPAPVASENVSEEVVTSTVPATSDAPETPETEATTSTAIDQPAVTDDASASPSSDPVSDPTLKEEASEEGATDAPSSPADPAIPSVDEHKGGGGSFESPFAEPKPALTMIERIELLEKRVAELEAK